METIFPYLVQEDLLTQGEINKLCGLSPSLTDDDKKISYLVEKVLPKKGRTALSRFVKCLECTSSGTAHIELANFIKTKAYALKEEDISLHKGICTMLCTMVSVKIKGTAYGLYNVAIHCTRAVKAFLGWSEEYCKDK